jgi:glycosyltransferase involved in cell wall biosynthesis
VVPSLWYENNPLVLQEAFAAGRPVLASNLGGMAEFTQPNVNGLLFPPGDAAALAQAMTALATDPALLARLRAHVPPVRTIAEEVTALTAIYRAVIDAAPQHA